MVTEGSIDQTVVDQLLEGFGVSVEDREAIISRNAKMIEAGDIAGLGAAVQAQLSSLAAQGKIAVSRLVKTAPIKGDLRAGLKGIPTAGEVAEAVGATTLDTAPDE